MKHVTDTVLVLKEAEVTANLEARGYDAGPGPTATSVSYCKGVKSGHLRMILVDFAKSAITYETVYCATYDDEPSLESDRKCRTDDEPSLEEQLNRAEYLQDR